MASGCTGSTSTPKAAPVIARIFAGFTAERGFYAISEGLTRDGIPSPSAHAPERNRHRSGIAWSNDRLRPGPGNSRRAYALRGCVRCGSCERRMQSHWAHDTLYCRCRFPREYALVGHVQHPLNVNLRESLILGWVNK